MLCLNPHSYKWIVIALVITLLTSGAYATVIDDFEDGDYTNNPTWTVTSDVWTAGNQVSPADFYHGAYGMRSGDNDARVKTSVTHSDNNYFWMWVKKQDGKSIALYLYDSTETASKSLAIQLNNSEQLQFIINDGAPSTKGTILNSTWYLLGIRFDNTNNKVDMEVYDTDFNLLFSGYNQTEAGTMGNVAYIYAVAATVSGDKAWFDYVQVDTNVNMLPTPATTPPSTDANFSWTIRKDLNKIILKDTSTDTNATITDWNWIINSVLVSNNQDYNHTATQLTDYNTCLYVYDDSNMLTASQECYTISTGDWQAPTVLVTATQRTNYTDANIVFTCTDNNSGCNKLFYQVDSNGWQIASITIGNFQTIYGGGAGTHTIYYIANDNNDNNSTQQTYTYTLTPDNIAPSLDYEISGGYGFTTDFNIEFNLTCYDNRLDDLNYKVWINDTNLVFNKMDANATTNYGSVIVGANQAITFKFQCVDGNGNTATETAPIVYPLLFRLINEDTGVQYTPADINTYFAQIKVYSPDGNYYFDFNAPAASQAYFIAEDNTLVFEIDYKDTAQTQINRTINFSLLTDTNIGICVPTLQTFYLQRFLSNQNRNILLKNNVAKCYTMASSMDYIYDTGYVQNVYTIAKPYYLYSRTAGVESVLAQIDGSEANQYNLDTLLLSRQDLDYVSSPDMIAFAPLLNPVTEEYDLNILQIYYESAYGLNQSVNLTITFNDTTLFTYDNTSTPNEFIISWDWSDTNLTDQNWVTMTFTITNTSGDITTLTYYVNPNGNYQQGAPINATWMAIFSIMLFILGLGIVSVDRFFGLFGALFCLICMALAAISYPVWWTFLLAASYFIILLYIIMMGKPSTNRSVA